MGETGNIYICLDYPCYLSAWSCSASTGMIMSHRCKWLAPSFPSIVLLQIFIRNKTLFLLNSTARASWGTLALLWSNLQTQQLLLRRNDFYKERSILSPQNCFLCKSCKSVSKEYTDKVYIYILKNTNAHLYLKVHSKWKSFTEVFLNSRKHVKCYEGYIDVKEGMDFEWNKFTSQKRDWHYILTQNKE